MSEPTLTELAVKIDVILNKLIENTAAHQEIVTKLDKHAEDYTDLFRNGPISTLQTRMTVAEKALSVVQWVGGTIGTILLGWFVITMVTKAFGG